MTLIEHGELVRRALEYVQEERCRRPDAPLSSLLDEAGMRFNLTPLDAAQLARLFSEKGQEPSAPANANFASLQDVARCLRFFRDRYLKKSPTCSFSPWGCC